MKISTKPNIHLVRGNIVHEVLEKFYDYDIAQTNESDFKKDIVYFLKNLFEARWRKDRQKLNTLGLTERELSFYYDESLQMLANWISSFFIRLDDELSKGMPLSKAFQNLRPSAIEREYKDKELMVRGFVDYIEERDGKIRLMDYKTSKKDEMTPEYRLQLAIYALLYKREHAKLPDEVGILFLKHGEKMIPVTDELIKHAEFELEQIHSSTESDHINDYPKNQSPLCKYSTGECDFYELCRRDE